MKAMILAAGRGTRLHPLTLKTAKPLIQVGNKKLIEYHLERLNACQITEVVINVAYKANQFMEALGDGSHYGSHITYSYEPDDQPLETGGGIHQALPLLGKSPFILINGDIWTDYPLENLKQQATRLNEHCLAHLVLISNPPWNHSGDFGLNSNSLLTEGSELTYSGLGAYHPELFSQCQAGRYPLAPLLHRAAEKKRLAGEHYQGTWFDAGTPERLMALRQHLA